MVVGYLDMGHDFGIFEAIVREERPRSDVRQGPSSVPAGCETERNGAELVTSLRPTNLTKRCYDGTPK